MKVLIDGYNLLHSAQGQLSPAGTVGLTIVQLAGWIGRWAAGRGHSVRIICDGSRPRGMDVAVVAGVGIEFVGPKTADEVIIAAVATSSGAKQWIVVSDDREIRHAAEVNRCQVIRCGPFLSQVIAAVDRPAKKPEPAEKQQGPAMNDAEMEYWLKTFGAEEIAEIESHADAIKPIGKKRRKGA